MQSYQDKGSASATHRALQCTELVLAILEQYDVRSPSDRATRARWALVCRSFADIASPLVWRTLPQLVPLWCLLLPGHRRRWWRRQDRALSQEWGEKSLDVIITGKPYENRVRWDNFLKYANYVREVDGANYSLGDCDLIRMVVSNNGGKTFLPSLQRLKWKQLIGSTPALELLSCSALLELRLDCSDRTLNLQFDRVHHMHALAAVLPPSFPSLRTLICVCPGICMDDVTPLFEELLPQFRNLHTLQIPRDWRPVTIASLSSLLPRLVRFECPIGRANHDPPWVDLYAPTLRELTSWGSYTDVYALISGIHAPGLETISLTCHDFDNPHSRPTRLEEFLEAITASVFSCSLRNISITISTRLTVTSSQGSEDVELLDARVFQSPHMSRLRSLDLVFIAVSKTRPSSTIVHSDESILALAQALPDLEFFKSFFTGVVAPAALPRPTLTPISLVHLARHCPVLQEIHLLTNLNSPLTVPLDFEPPRGHPLRVLNLPPSAAQQVIAAPKELGRMIGGLFPDIDVQASIASSKMTRGEHWRADRSWYEMWEEVGSLQRRRRDAERMGSDMTASL